jgi:uroporphyrinogen decarboxylase
VLGFVGAPWTLATYLVEGQNSLHYSVIKDMASQEPVLLHQLLAQLARSIAAYALYQIQNGAQLIQIFDSWAGHLTPDDYATFALPYQRQVIRAIKAIYPEVPVILYVHDSAALLPLMNQSGADVIHIDLAIPMGQAREILGDRPVQGNLDPCVLLGSPELIRDRTRDVIHQAGTQGHIMNLGQGILPTTPEENVRCFFDTVRSVTYPVVRQSVSMRR